MMPIEPDNPYAPPLAAIEPAGEGFEVPGDFGGKLAMAFRLFFGNLPMIAAVVVSVSLPANLVFAAIMASPAAAQDPLGSAFRFGSLRESLFGPLSAAALIGLLAERSAGRSPSFLSLIGLAFRRWGSMFGARLVAGMRVMIGLLALIIPGLVLGVRYALVDPVVILEPNRTTPAWVRSGQLVRGKGWEIFAVLTLSYFGAFAMAVVVAIASEALALGDWFEIATDCLSDLVFSFATVLMFLYYVDGRNRESRGPSDDEAFKDVAARLTESDH